MRKKKLANGFCEEQPKGFTLIEILVALAIFALITAVAVVSYQTANRKARDGRRRADLEQVRTALEIYRSDNGSYPVGDWAAMIADLQAPTVYLRTAPVDPRSSLYSYYYGDVGGGTSYNVCAYLEGGSTTSCPVVAMCTVACNYGVTSP